MKKTYGCLLEMGTFINGNKTEKELHCNFLILFLKFKSSTEFIGKGF